MYCYVLFECQAERGGMDKNEYILWFKSKDLGSLKVGVVGILWLGL